MKAFWKKEWKYGVTALVGGVLVCVLWSGVYAANIQRGIADGVVRFHVLANSDTTADQNLKLDVRDAVLASFGEKLEGCSSKGESMALLAAYKEEIRQIVELMMKDLFKRLSERDLSIEVTDEVKDFLAKDGYNEAYGARPLRRLIQKKIEDQLAEEILTNAYQPGDTILLKLEDDKIVFERKTPENVENLENA